VLMFISLFVFLYCFFLLYVHRYLHSSPTRRSSDLLAGFLFVALGNSELQTVSIIMTVGSILAAVMLWLLPLRDADRDIADEEVRSEEHTSELQSRENLVCRLLLEKKNIY